MKILNTRNSTNLNVKSEKVKKCVLFRTLSIVAMLQGWELARSDK